MGDDATILVAVPGLWNLQLNSVLQIFFSHTALNVVNCSQWLSISVLCRMYARWKPATCWRMQVGFTMVAMDMDCWIEVTIVVTGTSIMIKDGQSNAGHNTYNRAHKPCLLWRVRGHSQCLQSHFMMTCILTDQFIPRGTKQAEYSILKNSLAIDRTSTKLQYQDCNLQQVSGINSCWSVFLFDTHTIHTLYNTQKKKKKKSADRSPRPLGPGSQVRFGFESPTDVLPGDIFLLSIQSTQSIFRTKKEDRQTDTVCSMLCVELKSWTICHCHAIALHRLPSLSPYQAILCYASHWLWIDSGSPLVSYISLSFWRIIIIIILRIITRWSKKRHCHCHCLLHHNK